MHIFPPDVLKFDNSYSWRHSKEVFYSVKVLPPDSELSEVTPTKETGFNGSDNSDDEFFEANEQAKEKEEGMEEEEERLFQTDVLGTGLL